MYVCHEHNLHLVIELRTIYILAMTVYQRREDIAIVPCHELLHFDLRWRPPARLLIPYVATRITGHFR